MPFACQRAPTMDINTPGYTHTRYTIIGDITSCPYHTPTINNPLSVAMHANGHKQTSAVGTHNGLLHDVHH